MKIPKPEVLDLHKPAKRKPGRKAAPPPPTGTKVDKRAPGNTIARPQSGPGKPPAPRPPRDDHEAALLATLLKVEGERSEAAAAYRVTPTVACELKWLQAEMATATAQAAYLRAQGNMTHALAYGDLSVKLASKIFAARELLATDALAEIKERNAREDALGK